METKALSTAEQNAELVKRGYAAFNAGDLKTLAEIFDNNASWHSPGKSSVAGSYKGHDAVFGQFGRYGAETHGTFKAELKEVCANEEGRVVGIHRNTGTRNGKQLNVDCCIVFDIKNGKAVSGAEYFFDLRAWDEFWK